MEQTDPFYFQLSYDYFGKMDFAYCNLIKIFFLQTCRSNRSYKPNPRLARVLDILFILHAEHEMNCSTAAARHLASR